MRHGSLFSGIGGFDLAAESMGWENVFHCEINEFGRRVLNYYWPKAISYEDIKKTDFAVHRGGIDVLTGGFPCQPFSTAGKRKGSADNRHLWPEMLRAIREIQPLWIVGENVPGIISWSGGLVFEQVCSDLEAEGYEVQPVVLPAISVNAPHRRDRVWFVAHSIVNRYNTSDSGGDGFKSGELRENRSEKAKIQGEEYKRQRIRQNIGRVSKSEVTSDPESLRVNRASEHENDNRQSRKRRGRDLNNIGEIQGGKIAPDSNNKRLQRIEKEETRKESAYRSDWSEFPTQSPICGRNDGLPSGLAGITVSKHRNESIKAYGNAVVPQLVYQIFKVIEQYEENN